MNNLKLAEITVDYVRAEHTSVRTKISSSGDCYDVFKAIWKYPLDHRECMYALYLNRANIVLGQQLLSLGGISGTVVDVRMILQTALNVNASGIVIAHNHPSGNLLFSSSDREITQKLKEASSILDIKLLDHLVITSEGYSSMNDEGVF